MSDSSPDEQDSRIASLGAQRLRSSANSSARSSRHTSREPPSKRQRRSRKTSTGDVQDFVPRGASFSANSLEVDPATSPVKRSADNSEEDNSSSSASESSSSSGSSESESDSDNSSEKEDATPSMSASAKAGSAPAPNWNRTGKSVIRTSLRGRQPQRASASASTEFSSVSVNKEQFDGANGKSSQGRSASVSSGSESKSEQGKGTSALEGKSNTQALSPEEGEVEEYKNASTTFNSIVSDDSDDSESLDSEADDSIMLNTIGARGEDRDQNGVISISDDDDDDDAYDPVDAMILGAAGSRTQSQNKNNAISISDDDSADDYDPEALSINGDDYNPEALPILHTPAKKDIIFSVQNGTGGTAKEDAFARFAQKYPAAPLILADLELEDLEIQARAIFYDRDINDIDLQLPITCIECLREGHLAEVCPTKECVHCGAWNKHQTAVCPQRRRCQRCRERGHDQKHCPSVLKSSAGEVPCDLCGSSEHLELDCDYLWKYPRPDTTAQPVLVSISCANCTSNAHLIGDCPTPTRPFTSTTFTLRGIEQEIITNINSVISPKRGGGPSVPSGRQQGMKIRGRADQARSPSPDSDDMMSRGGKKGPIGGNRNANRGNINIRIGSNAGKNRNPHPPPARDYRDREDPYPRNNNSRQRSMSPGRDRRPGRGRGGWQPGPPRSPPRGQGRPPPPRSSRGGSGGGGGRGNGRGRGGGHRGGGDSSYRPMPSAAKKAWDKYRL
ncbi:hypothetical protein BJY01DRAFT_242006 [Aspergillus pseudoustus]|uniref:CCHC-type domain-containing protein n=1 Tax=Aspergillus pseudoustus TaxID=1810923 RepID=A0ABR4L069_9EURO